MTMGGIDIGFEDSNADILFDQLGTAPADKIMTGRKITVTVPLAQATQEALALVAKGIWHDPTTGTMLSITNPVGERYKVNSRVLKLVKIIGGIISTNDDDMFYIPHSAPVFAADLKYDATAQRVFPMAFDVYVSPLLNQLLAASATGRLNWMTGLDEYPLEPSSSGTVKLPIFGATKAMIDANNIEYTAVTP